MDHSTKIRVLRQLARTAGDISATAIEKEAAKISTTLDSEANYDRITEAIEQLDTIAYRVPEVAVSTIRRLIRHLEKTDLSYDTMWDWPPEDLALYRGKGNLIAEALKLLDRIRYHRIEEVLDILTSNADSASDTVRKQVRIGLEHLAEYNIDVYFSGSDRAGLGSAPQFSILKWLEGLNSRNLQEIASSAAALCKHMLSPTMGSTSWDFQGVTLTSAPIRSSDDVKDVRGRSVELLMRLYKVANTISQKSEVIGALLEATRHPHRGDYGDELSQMIAENTVSVLGFLESLVRHEELQVIQRIEHDAYWRFRHANSDQVKEAALRVRDEVAIHSEYEIYRNLIGFEGVFENWENASSKEHDFGEIEAYRSAMAIEYAESIDEENWNEWRARILLFAKTESNDLATFPKFYAFLEQFSKSAPDLAMSLLRKDIDGIQLFAIPLLRGLWNGPLKADLRKLILDWITEDQQLVAVTKLFVSTEQVDDEILQTLLDKGIKTGNREVLVSIVNVALSKYPIGHKDYLKKYLLVAVGALCELRETGWLDQFWFRKDRGEILHDLGPEGCEVLLSSMLLVSNIDHQAEELLIPIARVNPQRVVEFFGDRQRYANEHERGRLYDAIPFSFHRLHEPLAKSPELVVNIVRQWFDDDGELFRYRGANLLKIVFPDFPREFESILLKLVQTGDRSNVDFVLSVLTNYEGQSFLHSICKEIIAVLPEDDDLHDRTMVVLDSTGVVSGEFGFAEAYERKAEEMKTWLTDKNDKVRRFAAEHSETLKRIAESERQRAVEEIALRKHVYGVRSQHSDHGAAERNHESESTTKSIDT